MSWRRNLRPVHITVVVALAVNLILLSAYLWSHGGQTTTLRVEIRGDEFTVSLDGRERIRQRMAAPATGGIRVFKPNPRSDPSTLPTHGKIERLTISTLQTGQTLVDMSSFDTPRPLAGRDPPVLLDLSNQRWGDVAVEITYRNTLELDVDLRATRTDAVTLRLFRFGFHNLTLRSTLEPGQGEVGAAGASSEVSPERTVRAIVASVLRPYPLLVVFAALLAAATYGLHRARIVIRTGTVEVPHWAPFGTAALLALSVLLLATFILRIHLDALPRIPDEGSYIFQARILASGRTHLETPPVPDAFSFANIPSIIDYDGSWASFYTFGNSLLLVPGVLVGAPWIIHPLLAALSVVLAFGIARRVYGVWTGLLAAALFASSPFVLMQASSYMSHTAAAALVLGSVLAIVQLPHRPILAGVIAGLLFGMFFNTRPLSAVMFAPASGLLLAGGLLRTGDRIPRLTMIAAFSVAVLAMLGAYFAYNWSITGDPLENGYQASGDLGQTVGFGGAHNVADGVDNQLWNMVALLVVLNGWPAWIGLGFVLAPFVLGSRHPFDWFLLASAVLIFSGAALYFTTGMVNGPRYIFEAVPFLLLLTARGVVVLLAIPARMLSASPPDEPRTLSFSAVHVVLAAPALLLLAASVFGWILSRDSDNEIFAAPASASDIKRDSIVDDRLVRAADRMDLHNALVVVDRCDINRSCYLSVFLQNNLDLDSDVVWVYDIGEQDNARVRALYPCRALYTANYATATIKPAGRTPAPPGGACDK